MHVRAGAAAPVAPDPARAQRLWLAALDRYIELDTEPSLELLRRAEAADPAFVPAYIYHINTIMYRADARAQLRAEYERRSDPLARCLAAIVAAPVQYPAAAVTSLRDIEQRYGANPCTTTQLALALHYFRPQRVWSDSVAARARRAVRDWPQLGDVWHAASRAVAAVGRLAEARALLEEGLPRQKHALHRALLYAHLTEVLEETEPARGADMRRALAAAVERDGRPGLRYYFPDYVRYAQADGAEPLWLRRARERLRAALLGRDREREWGARRELGSTLSDAGRPIEALPHVQRGVAIADSIGGALLQIEAYRFRGRVYAKLGRLHDAERDLLHAIDIGKTVNEPYLLAEVYHNLAHVYEGAGDVTRASTAIDRFVALTAPLQHSQPRMMSLRDAGLIRWKAGRPAAANAAFADMAAVVDEQERNNYWAGEYFERNGELTRALHYFRRGYALDAGERALNLGGLARVHEALGMPDSAEAAARAHDEALSNQLSVPLLPPILARQGRTDEAIRISRDWSARQLERGNVQGATLATLALSELLLDADAPADALREAVAAESLAVQLNFTDEHTRAQRLQGLAHLHNGEVARALPVLQRALERAEAHPTAETLLLTRLAYADALAQSGDARGTLDAYDRAAQAVERVTALLDVDLNRTRYRERHLAPFDGALRALLSGEHDDHDAVARWSQRRKAAALALASRNIGAVSSPVRQATLAELQHKLAPSSALIDYLVVDSAVYALVVRTRATHILKLPVSLDSVRQLSEAMTRGFHATYAGRVDLARVAFSFHAAHALFRALLEPLLPQLAEVQRLHVVPDGPLHAVPFDALVESLPATPGDYGSARYAIDRFEIELLPSSWFLPSDVAPRRPLPSASRVLLVTRNVPGGEQERAAILSAWKSSRVTVLADDDATESALRRNRARHDILHFAVHARADDHDPARSHLRLAADSVDDGFLHLSEVTPDAVRLVVLSACETLAGRIYRGEGLMGLARAFLSSGAESVVATRWPVGPATAALMADFHRDLAAGEQPAAALRAARLRLRHDSATAHPFFWSAFVLIEGRPSDRAH